MATTGLGIGWRSSGLSPGFCNPGAPTLVAGIVGGTPPTGIGSILFIFVALCSPFSLLVADQVENRLKDAFIKISVQRVLAQELHRQTGRANERPQDPGQLAAEEEIARQPRKQDPMS